MPSTLMEEKPAIGCARPDVRLLATTPRAGSVKEADANAGVSSRAARALRLIRLDSLPDEQSGILAQDRCVEPLGARGVSATSG
jgi:hypothetical protein